MATAGELRELDDAELITRLAEAKEELFNLRFQNATGQLDNYARLAQVKKEIARLATIVREREIEAAEAQDVLVASEKSQGPNPGVGNGRAEQEGEG